jgi:hypothetical protein
MFAKLGMAATQKAAKMRRAQAHDVREGAVSRWTDADFWN